MKHTPGPWKYRPQAVSSNGFYIETGTDIRSGSDQFVGEVGGGIMPEDEIEANAKLISVAPELLKVCNDLLAAFQHKNGDKKGNQVRMDIFKYCPEFRQIAVDAREAIQRATE